MSKYLNFSRTVERSEYWAVIIITWLLGIFVWGISALLITTGDAGVLMGATFMLISAVLLVWASLATIAGRCRAAGLNPWWAASTVIPYIGFVTMIVFGCLESKTADVAQVAE